ncbi:DUF6973 domain-containing protein [Corynebacterium godavarianum]|uniref:DUF6973 domain-containing protein n=1 Tax=Corynebacterium godavarianum TaxID=2054421 RepID=UPI0039C0E2E2
MPNPSLAEVGTKPRTLHFARKIGDAHEIDHPGSPEAGTHMDQTNNAIGRDIGLRHEGDEAGAINECHA